MKEKAETTGTPSSKIRWSACLATCLVTQSNGAGEKRGEGKAREEIRRGRKLCRGEWGEMSRFYLLNLYPTEYETGIKINIHSTHSGCVPSVETLAVCLTQIDNKIWGSKKWFCGSTCPMLCHLRKQLLTIVLTTF